ncbi:MAG: DUF6477 family protein [Pseudomonadota bacterium]
MNRKLRRPRILTSAAKAGASLYRRDRDLGKILPKLTARVGKTAVIAANADEEAKCETERAEGVATYSISRHIGLLAALLAESRGGPAAA